MDNYDTESEEEVIEEEAEEVEETEEQEAEETDYKAELEKTKAELEKAQRAILKNKQKPKTEATPINGLSTTDILALSRANIADEDIDEVLDYAKYKKVSIAEALKSTVVKATLAEKAEQRTSALAVNTGGGRRASGTTSDERLLADASKGILPESDADLARLARLRFKNK